MLRPRQPERHGRNEALPAGQHAAVVVARIAQAGPAFPRWFWGRGTGTGRASSPRSIGRRAHASTALQALPCAKCAGAASGPDDMLPPRNERPHAPIHRTAASPQGRPAPRHRRRSLQRRRQPARPGLCLRAALAACPRAHPRHRHRGGARHAGRAGGADRRGCRGRWAEGRPAHADPDRSRRPTSC